MTAHSIQTFATEFNSGRIVRYGDRIDMEVKGATFATWHPDELLTGYSWDAMSAAALLHPSRRPRDILLLGLAGGTMVRILRHLIPGARITAVEVDRELVDLAAEHMHLDMTAFALHIGDAYAFLEETPRRFDVILDDVFLSGASDVYRPEHVDTDLVVRYQQALKKDGIVALNMITDKPHRPLLKRTAAALASGFPERATITAPRGYNQALTAGNNLRRDIDMQTKEAVFPSKADRRMWKRLKVD